MKQNASKKSAESATRREGDSQRRVARQRLGLRQSSAAFAPPVRDGEAAEGCRSPKPRGIRHPARVVVRVAVTFFALLAIIAPISAADKYTGTCNVVFEGDSTLHAFSGDITNIAVVVLCDTNSAGAAMLNTRLEIAPKQLSTHHAKRDKNMYAMFQSDKFPKLLAVVTNAPLAAAKLTPTEAAGTNGVVLVQLTFCGITKEVSARTMNPTLHTNGWEFDLQTEVSLKAFQLKPSSTLFGIISVDDKVVVKAHLKVEKDTAK